MVKEITLTGKSILEIWQQYDACELTIKDTDGLLVWHGEFEDMPVKYLYEIVVCVLVDDYNAELLIIVESEGAQEIPFDDTRSGMSATDNIKALEQEPILDKIRAELLEISEYDYIPTRNAMEIIDKYKESEG